MKQKKLAFLKLAIVVIGVIILSICVFLLPRLARDTAVLYPEFAYLQFPVLLGIYATAIPFFLGLYQSLKLLQYIESKDAFSELAVISLGYIKNYALTIISIYVMGMLLLGILSALHPGIAIIGIVIIFTSLVISFFAAVLQELLRNAIDIKLENDLTV